MFGFGKKKEVEQPIAELNKGFADFALKQIHIQVFKDRVGIRLLNQIVPTMINRKDIRSYVVESQNLTKGILKVIGQGTVLFTTPTLGVAYLKEAEEFLNTNAPVEQQETKNDTGKTVSVDDLPKLKQLLDAGIITQAEFDEAKKKALGI